MTILTQQFDSRIQVEPIDSARPIVSKVNKAGFTGTGGLGQFLNSGDGQALIVGLAQLLTFQFLQVLINRNVHGHITSVKFCIYFNGNNEPCQVSKAMLDFYPAWGYNMNTQIKTAGISVRTAYTSLTTANLRRRSTMACNTIPRTPDSGQDLPTELLNRIHTAAQDPTGQLSACLIRQLCPGLTSAVAMEWLKADLAFEQEAVRQAAELMNGTWEA